LSDIVFPNLTELKLLSGFDLADDEPFTIYAAQFKQLYPSAELVLTSAVKDEQIGIVSFGKEHFEYWHESLPKSFGGSGDAFLALFILNHYYRSHSFEEALKLAADQTHRLIKNSIQKHSDDLVLEIIEPNI
jgi:pyridoxal/pyridoxine/pyridoxamine kinase